MEKRNWNGAISIAKKAKDKSIYNFIVWRHLLTKGNHASFFEYKVFIDENSDYPRINRLKYLAEHKLSTEKISPNKIIDWFNGEEPFSGYGKLILGERLIKIGDVTRSSFGKLYCYSFATAFFIYVGVNMGMVLGLLPIVGAPLPIMSYGGSSMMAIMLGLGIAMSCRVYKDTPVN